jgi:hypothetical protein
MVERECAAHRGCVAVRDVHVVLQLSEYGRYNTVKAGFPVKVL